MSAQDMPAVIVKAKAYAAFLAGLLGTLAGVLATLDAPGWLVLSLAIATPVVGYVATYQAPYLKPDPDALPLED